MQTGWRGRTKAKQKEPLPLMVLLLAEESITWVCVRHSEWCVWTDTGMNPKPRQDLEKFLVRKNIAQVWESPCTDEEIYRCMGPSMSALHIYCISKNTNYQQPNWKVAVLFCLKGKTKTSVEVLAKGNAVERSKCIAVLYYYCRLPIEIES